MSIQLRPETQKRIEDCLKSGGFQSADELVLAGLNLLQETKTVGSDSIQIVRQQIALGLQQLDRGDSVDGDQAFAELLAELDNDGGKP
jgi:antitoxin ParD1/3/4